MLRHTEKQKLSWLGNLTQTQLHGLVAKKQSDGYNHVASMPHLETTHSHGTTVHSLQLCSQCHRITHVTYKTVCSFSIKVGRQKTKPTSKIIIKKHVICGIKKLSIDKISLFPKFLIHCKVTGVLNTCNHSFEPTQSHDTLDKLLSSIS